MAGRDVMAEPTNKPINGATICLPAGTSLSLFPSLSLSRSTAFRPLHSSPLDGSLFLTVSPSLSLSLSLIHCSCSPLLPKQRRHWQQHHFMRSWNEIHARGLSIRGELPQLLFHDNERSHPVSPVSFSPSFTLSLSLSLLSFSLTFPSLSLFCLVKRDFQSVSEFSAITRAPWFLKGTFPTVSILIPVVSPFLRVGERQVALGLRKWKYGP